MCIQLKEEMGVENIKKREEELIDIIWERMSKMENVHILAQQHKDRLGVISFYIDDLHYNLGVKLLNDKFGIQTRGGCSCAGTYGHYLFGVSQDLSDRITSEISQGNCTEKPGWMRMSIHPTMSDEEVEFIMDGIEALANNFKDWAQDYELNLAQGKVQYKDESDSLSVQNEVDECFLVSFA